MNICQSLVMAWMISWPTPDNPASAEWSSTVHCFSDPTVCIAEAAAANHAFKVAGSDLRVECVRQEPQK